MYHVPSRKQKVPHRGLPVGDQQLQQINTQSTPFSCVYQVNWGGGDTRRQRRKLSHRLPNLSYSFYHQYVDAKTSEHRTHALSCQWNLDRTHLLTTTCPLILHKVSKRVFKITGMNMYKLPIRRPPYRDFVAQVTSWQHQRPPTQTRLITRWLIPSPPFPRLMVLWTLHTPQPTTSIHTNALNGAELRLTFGVSNVLSCSQQWLQLYGMTVERLIINIFPL